MKTVTLTPEKAREILKKNIDKRRPDPKKVKSIAKEMMKTK